MKKNMEIIGIGSAFVDYFFDTNQDFLDIVGLEAEHSRPITTQEFARLFSHQKLLGKSMGGSTPITLKILSQLGLTVGYAGIIGKDTDGDFWRKQGEHIDLHIAQKGSSAQSACLLTDQRKKRSFLYTLNEKENDFFQDMDYVYLNECQFLHITQFYHNPEKTLQQLTVLVQKITNPHISFTPGSIYCSQGLSSLSPLFQKAHVLFFSTYELEMLFTDVKEGSRKLLEYGPKIIVCTLGEKGALITTKDQQFYSPAEKVSQIIDTTGAGDAFAAGFLSGLIKKKTLQECAKIGNHMGATSLSDFGSRWLDKER